MQIRARVRRGAGNAGALAVMIIVLGVPVLYVIGFTSWTAWISFTNSTLLPNYTLIGFSNYTRILRSSAWQIAFINLAIYAGLFLVFCSALGFSLAVLLEQRIRAENLLRALFLYPMAVSFVVTGTVWAWLLNPSIGIQTMVRALGWTSFKFDWIVDRDMAIYTVVLAAVWQASGFAMALFLAGLRSLDGDLLKAAQIDGAGPLRYYLRVALPAIWPVVAAVTVILLQFAVKTYDLVVALTAGGPGLATTLPTIVVYNYMFQRGQLGFGSAAAVMILLSLGAILVPVAVLRRWRAARELRAAHV